MAFIHRVCLSVLHSLPDEDMMALHGVMIFHEESVMGVLFVSLFGCRDDGNHIMMLTDLLHWCKFNKNINFTQTLHF